MPSILPVLWSRCLSLVHGVDSVYNDGSLHFGAITMRTLTIPVVLVLLLTAAIAHANEEFYYLVKLDKIETYNNWGFYGFGIQRAELNVEGDAFVFPLPQHWNMSLYVGGSRHRTDDATT